MKKQFFLVVVLLGLAGMTIQAQQRKVMFEQFTSSTCGPCATMNTWLTPLLQNNADKVVVVKYQMSWPSPGDPYYTAEGGARRGYYGVNAVPAPFTDGVSTGSQSAIQNAINTGYAKPAEATITGNFRVVGNMIYVQTTVTPLISGNNYVIHCVVNEKTTTKNKMYNGETVFHHVMMKMFPNGGGTELTLKEGQPVVLSFSHDMSTTFVEEMDDLEVAVFVQNKSTKAILNAEYLSEDNTMSLPPTNTTASQEGETLNIGLSWAPPVRDVTGYNIYRNGIKLNTTPITGTTYNDIAPEYGITYQYGIGAIVDGKEGFWGMIYCQTKVIVPKPTNVTVKQLQGFDMLVSWDKPDTELPVKYYVYRNAILQNPGNPTSDTVFENTGTSYMKYCFEIVPIVNEIKGKQSDKECITLTEVAISETGQNALFSIFPNPVSGTLNINVKEPITDCQIFNIQGQLIYSTKSNIKEITTENWDAGIYIIYITTENGSAEKRFIKK